MTLSSSARLLSSALVVLSLGLGLQGPPCLDPSACPIDQTAAAGTCDGMAADCCEEAGERAPQTPAATPPAPCDAPAAMLGAVQGAQPWPSDPIGPATPPGRDRQALLSVFLI